MTWKETLKYQKQEQDFLNTIDLLPFLERDKSIFLIMDEIESKYREGNIYKEEPYLFNCMDCNEFMDYLVSRYPNIGFYECIDYKLVR